MPLSINTNMFALNAQRNLNRSQAPLTTAMQRLSSTLRINSAKDDAAGLSIATRMTRQVNGLSVAMRNANDGVSVAQTAEGAMDEMMWALQRMNELAEQSASYNTALDRSSINQEVRQLIDELGRIVNQTRYNGEKLLAGAFSADIQVGVEVNETINISLSNMSPTAMGVATNYSEINALSDSALAGRIQKAFFAATVAAPTLEGTQIGALTTQTLSSEKIANINSYTNSTGVTAFGYGNGLVARSYDATANNMNGLAAGSLVINGISIDAVADAATDGAVANDLVTAINAKTAQHGVVAANLQIVTGGNYSIVLINRTGAAITATANTSVDPGIETLFAPGTTSISAGANGAIVLNDRLNDVTVEYNSTATGLSITGVGSATTTLANSSVNAQVVSTSASANLAILTFKEAMESINSEKSILGATLNRFESVIRNLDNARENISAARSRIMDADFAVETSNLTKAMIMQQAGISVLAQANTLPQNVLALLQR